MKTWSDFGIDVPNTGRPQTATTCPQCSNQRRKKQAKCLSVNITDGIWQCHHCGWSGTLKAGANSYDPYSHWKREYRRPVYDCTNAIDSEADKWFKTRGISTDTCKAFSVASQISWMPQNEAFVPVVTFPFKRGDDVVNVKYRSYEKHFRMEAGAERVLYNLNAISETTIVVEGEMDALSCHEAGFPNVVSVPDGAPSQVSANYSSKFDFLENCSAELAKVKSFILAVDNDAPGETLAAELCRRFGIERCLRTHWPEGCKDANDVLVKHGPAALKQCIESATPYPVEGVTTANALRDRLLNVYEHGYKQGVHPGWGKLANLYTVRPGEWTVITGIPGHGKSEFLDALMVNLANQHGWRFAIYSPENYPIEQHVIKLLEKQTGKTFHQGYYRRMATEELDQATHWADHQFSFIEPAEEEALKLDYILEKARHLVFQKGINGLVIDPWNELDHQRPPNLTETEYVSQCLGRIRQFARRNQVHVWVVAHPTKLIKLADGQYPVPTPYDISGSAHWRNKADNAITVWRDFKANDGTVQVHVQKIRFKQVGRVGQCNLYYNDINGQYSDGTSPSTASC